MATTLDLGNLLVHLKADATGYDRVMRSVEMGTGRLLKRLKQTAVAVASGSLYAFGKFDSEMTKSLAIMKNVTTPIRREMEDLALTMSRQGIKSAHELARSYFYLASAGLDVKQSMSALGAVEKFAVAGAFDMATATTLAMDAQSALGLRAKDAMKNLESLTQVMDVLVGANTLANASTEQFSYALTAQAGAAMKAFGVTLEDGIATLAAYADQGIKAEHAGATFSRVLRLMTRGFQNNRSAWNSFGIDIYNAHGNLRRMEDVIGDLTEAMAKMGTEERTAALMMLGFQARSQQAILPLLGAEDRIKWYREEIEKMGGIMETVANKQLKSFASSMIRLKNQVVAVGIAIGRQLAPSLRDFANVFAENQSDMEWWASNVAVYVNAAVKMFSSFAVYMSKDWTNAFKFAFKTVIVSMKALGDVIYLIIKDVFAKIKRDIGDWVKDIPKAIYDAMSSNRAEEERFYKKIQEQIQKDAEAGVNVLSKSYDARKRLGMDSGKVLDDMGFEKYSVLYEGWVDNMTALIDAQRDVGKAGTEFAESHLKTLKQINEALKESNSLYSQSPYMRGLIRKTNAWVGDPFDINTIWGAPSGPKPEVGNRFEDVDEEMETARKGVSKMIKELQLEYNLLGKINEARERAMRYAEFEDKVRSKEAGYTVKEQQELLQAYGVELDKLIAGKRGPAAWSTRLKQWESDATNVYANVADVATSAFDSISTSLADMVMKGKADFRDLTKSILADILTIFVRAQIVAPLAGALGGLFGGASSPNLATQATGVHVAHSGGIVGQSTGRSRRHLPSSIFDFAPRLHKGLNTNEFPAVLERGETVIPAGGSVPSVAPSVIINNNTGIGMKQEKGGPKWNGREWVVGIVVEDLNSQGAIARTMQGLQGNGY